MRPYSNVGPLTSANQTFRHYSAELSIKRLFGFYAVAKVLPPPESSSQRPLKTSNLQRLLRSQFDWADKLDAPFYLRHC